MNATRIDLARRRLIGAFGGFGAVATVGAGALCARARAEPPERVVQIVAKRFVFLPETIELAVGQPVRLTLATLDVVMGFSCPELKLRADITPDRLTTLRVTPTRPGVFAFNCDVFCGSGHEDMSGTVRVV